MPHASYIGQNSQIKLLMGGAGRMTPPPNLRLSPAPLPKDPRIRTPDRSCGQERSAAKGPKSGRSATPQAASRPYDLTQTEVISYRIASLLSSVKFATFFLEVPVPVLEALSTNINNIPVVQRKMHCNRNIAWTGTVIILWIWYNEEKNRVHFKCQIHFLLIKFIHDNRSDGEFLKDKPKG